ncbi:MAG: DUF819 family protein [Miniphocaeibacter sp.]|uniref:DUF819 family protein n=1 Tax=Miniphocaeibacter sp. TaxID=3100973 RepID=UPI003BB21752
MITSGLGFLALLALINAAVFYLTKRYPFRVYKYLPPIIIVFIIVVICNTFRVWDMGVDEVKGARQGFLDIVIPFMIFTITLQTDIRKIIKMGPKLLGTFFAATISICIGMVITCLVLASPLGLEQIPESFGTWTASFTGGIENLYAVAKATGLSDAALSNVLLLINVVFRPWMTVLIVAVVAIAPKYNQWANADTDEIKRVAKKVDNGEIGKGAPSQLDLFVIAGIGFSLVTAGMYLGEPLSKIVTFIPAEVWLYIIVTFGGVLLGTFTKLGQTNGLVLIGGTLAVFSLSVSSSSTDLRSFMNAGIYLLAGVMVLGIHTIILLLMGKLMKMDLCTLGIASIANVGGVSSAPVVAAAYGEQYQAVSVLMAALGSILGTFIGLGMTEFLRMLL